MTYASGQSDFVQFVTQIFSEVHLLAVSWITISLCLIRTSGSYLPTFAVRDVDLHLHFNEDQCGQMVRLFVNIWSLATMKMRPIMSQICQSKHSILRNKKYIKNLPKTCEILPKWRNFAKSGHTGPSRTKSSSEVCNFSKSCSYISIQATHISAQCIEQQ